MIQYYLTFKALHIIAVVTWFAGLFYMPRLMIYFAEANEKPELEKNILQSQFKIMQRRLWYGITWPSSIIAPIFAGFLMMQWNPRENPWLRMKLWLVVGLYLYQFFLHWIFKNQQKGIVNLTSFKLRLINEISTLFLVSIVFLVVMKDTLSLIMGLTILTGLILLILCGIKIYKFVREN
jgi:putative membrane protein